MEATLDKKNIPHSLKRLWALIIALLALIGLFNQSIGAFWSFNFYFLLGNASITFFIFVLVTLLVLARRVTLKNSRLVILVISFSLITLLSSALFYQAGYPTSDFVSFNANVKALGNHVTYFNNPNILYQRFEGGYFGGLLYTALFTLVGRTASLIILYALLGISLILVFWPLLLMFFKVIARKLKTLRHRNAVIREARKVPTDQTISLIKGKEDLKTEELSVPPTPILIEKVENNTFKKAIFGEDLTQEAISFSPVAMSVRKIGVVEESIDADDLSEKVQQHNAVLQESLVKETETQLEKPHFDEVKPSQAPIVEEAIEEVNILESLLKEADIPQVRKAAEIKPATFGEEEKAVSTESIQPMINTPIVEEEDEAVFFEETPKVKPVKTKSYDKYEYPSLDLLNFSRLSDEMEINRRAAEERMEMINAALNNFKVGARAISFTIGPSITRFDVKMDDDKSVSTLTKYISDLNIRLGGLTGRFEQIIIGKSTSGYEVPNEKVMPVTLRDCIIQLPNDEKNKFAIPFGKNIDGKVIIGRVDEFPHLLVAGSTGSGKSVFVHSILVTLLMRTRPDELKLLIIDPKRVEMTKYRDIPHLLCPIVKEAKEARVALDKLADEMERRYRLFEDLGANKLSEYNSIAKQKNKEILPRIIVVIDEYADLVESEKEISVPLLRLAQKSRAAGINIIVATQRPSAEIITGTIKANLPARVALMTASATDSMVILGQGGAESLLGNGDMLVDWAQLSNQGFTRIQGAFVDNGEIRAVTDYLKNNYPPHYMVEFLDLSERSDHNFIAGTPRDFKDEIYEDVKAFVLTQDTISINRIQTSFNITFNRAKPIYDMLMAEGIIVPPDASNSSRGAKVVHQLPPSRDEIRIENNDY